MLINQNDVLDLNDEKVHPWRVCPIGQHFVREYVRHIPPSKEHPSGSDSLWREHCAKNPSHKDELNSYEIEYISKNFFSSLLGAPASGKLTDDFPSADNYDVEIRGWVKYWNEVLKPDELLDPNLIKSLIATESSFIENPKRIHKAHGLMQIRNETIKILEDPKGELTDYLIRINENDILKPSVNICMGVRWLFQKKKLASLRLKRKATWEEAVIEYKSYWDKVNSGEIPDGIKRLREYLAKLES